MVSAILLLPDADRLTIHIIATVAESVGRAVLAECAGRAYLVEPHEPRVASDVSGHCGGEPASLGASPLSFRHSRDPECFTQLRTVPTSPKGS